MEKEGFHKQTGKQKYGSKMFLLKFVVSFHSMYIFVSIVLFFKETFLKASSGPMSFTTKFNNNKDELRLNLKICQS